MLFSGIAYGFLIWKTLSGRMFQPFRHVTGTGLSRGSPSGAPPSTQSIMLRISRSLKRLSFANRAWSVSANHGGILRVSTCSLIALAHGRASAYVSNDIGPISPGRWHVWQFRCNIGSTSRSKVGDSGGEAMVRTVNAMNGTINTNRIPTDYRLPNAARLGFSALR